MPEIFTNRQTPEVMFANCGHGNTRLLKDCATLNFISAGQGDLNGVREYYFSNQIRNLIIGDVIAVYRNKIGYVGIAKVISRPMKITEAILFQKPVTPDIFSEEESDMFRNSHRSGYAECLVEIKWLSNVHLGDKKGSGACYGIFAKPHVVCSLDNQDFLKEELQRVFNLNFEQLLRVDR